MEKTQLQKIPNSKKFRLIGLKKEHIQLLKENKDNVLKALLAIGGTGLVTQIIRERDVILENVPNDILDWGIADNLAVEVVEQETTPPVKPEVIQPNIPDSIFEPTIDAEIPESTVLDEVIENEDGLIDNVTPDEIVIEEDELPIEIEISEDEIAEIIDIDETIIAFDELDMDEDLITIERIMVKFVGKVIFIKEIVVNGIMYH